MDELLAQYTPTNIIIFIIVFLTALKTFGVTLEWLWERVSRIFTRKQTGQQYKATIDKHIEQSEEQIQQLFDLHSKTEQNLDKILNSIQLLINSDKDDIKAWITEKHHYYCYEKKHIDDYSLDCIEKRYTHYKNEGGNSFVEDLMKDIRKLPKTIDSPHYKNK